MNNSIAKEGNTLIIQGVECYEKDGIAYLNLEAVARGLGFTQTQNKNGAEYVSTRWETVRRYLVELGLEVFPNKSGKEGLPAFIPENVFYRLCMKAKNAVAEAFQAKVADEIIPAIRKHGMYMTPNTLKTLLADPNAFAALANQYAEEYNARMAAEKKLEEQAPKVLFADSVSDSPSCVLIGELAKILKQNGVPVGQNRLFQRLRNDGFLISRKGTDYNMPTQYSMERGLMIIKETQITHKDGHITISKTPKITGKGQVFFVNRYASN